MLDRNMRKYTQLPAINGKRLIKLLQKDGWEVKRRAQHGVALAKAFENHTKVTVVPDTKASLDEGTLSAILGPKQTNIGKKRLVELVNKYGI